MEDWKLERGADKLSVRFQAEKDHLGQFNGEVKTVHVSSLVPEDSFELSSKNSFKYFGAPAVKGSALAVCTVTPDLTLCSGAEVRIRASEEPRKYKKGKDQLSFMVIGSFIAKKNPVNPTFHVSYKIRPTTCLTRAQTALLLDWERSLTLNDAQIVSRIHTIATRELFSFLNEHGDFEYIPRTAMKEKKAKNAENVIATCRRVIAPYLATFTSTLKSFRSCASVHADWNSKFLKAPASNANEQSEDDIEIIPEVLTILNGKRNPKRSKRGSNSKVDPEGDHFIESSPTKKPKPSIDKAEPVDKSPCSGSDEAVVANLKARNSRYMYF